MVGKKRGKKEIGVHGAGVDPGALKYSTAGGRADGADADGFGPWNGWTGGTGCRVGRGGPLGQSQSEVRNTWCPESAERESLSVYRKVWV